MAKCPNCGVTLLGSMETCPKCYFNLRLGNFDPAYKDVINKREETAKANADLKKREAELERLREIQRSEAEKQWTANSMNFKCTTGYSFDGYRIVQYLGIKSGEVVLGTGFLSEFSAGISDMLGMESSSMAGKLTSAKNAAIQKLEHACLSVCANAVIGVDIDIMTLGQNMIVACANGTAVKIEKE